MLNFEYERFFSEFYKFSGAVCRRKNKHSFHFYEYSIIKYSYKYLYQCFSWICDIYYEKKNRYDAEQDENIIGSDLKQIQIPQKRPVATKIKPRIEGNSFFKTYPISGLRFFSMA
jgi:hypothetical protein